MSKAMSLSDVLTEMIKELDLVSVVRCKNCKYQSKGENESESWNLCVFRPWLYIPTSDDHFCASSERKDGDSE